MSDTGTTTEAQTAERKRAAASNFLPIVRGRLPLLFVHAIRFDAVLNAMSNKDLAAKFGTSVGKVFDIKKNRNFSYVTDSYKPSAEDIAAARAWISQIGAENAKGKTAAGDTDLLEKTVVAYESRGLASAEDTAALSAARGANRKVGERKPKAEGGEVANAGDGAALLS